LERIDWVVALLGDLVNVRQLLERPAERTDAVADLVRLELAASMFPHEQLVQSKS
jgi:hypothetical protein